MFEKRTAWLNNVWHLKHNTSRQQRANIVFTDSKLHQTDVKSAMLLCSEMARNYVSVLCQPMIRTSSSVMKWDKYMTEQRTTAAIYVKTILTVIFIHHTIMYTYLWNVDVRKHMCLTTVKILGPLHCRSINQFLLRTDAVLDHWNDL